MARNEQRQISPILGEDHLSFRAWSSASEVANPARPAPKATSSRWLHARPNITNPHQSIALGASTHRFVAPMEGRGCGRRHRHFTASVFVGFAPQLQFGDDINRPKRKILSAIGIVPRMAWSSDGLCQSAGAARVWVGGSLLRANGGVRPRRPEDRAGAWLWNPCGRAKGRGKKRRDLRHLEVDQVAADTGV